MIGPAGERGRPHRWWTPVRLVLAASVLAGLLTALAQLPCATGSDPRWWEPPRGAATLCASDLPGQYLRSGLAEGALPLGSGDGRYVGTDLTAPVAVVAAGTAVAARILVGTDAADVAARPGLSPDEVASTASARSEALAYTALAALVQLLAWWAVVLLVTRAVLVRRGGTGVVSRGVPPSSWWLAAPPVLVVAGLTGWDLLPLAVAVAGFVAWRSGRGVLGGVLVGLATAGLGWAVAVLVAVTAVALRGPDREATRALAGALGTWLLLSVGAFVLSAGESADALFGGTAGLGASGLVGVDDGTVWSLVRGLGLSPSSGQLGTVTAVGWLLVLGIVVGLAQLRRWTLDPAALVVVALVGLLLVGTRFEPSQSLWLLPFVVLAHRGPAAARDIGLWTAFEVLAVLTRAWDVLGVTDAFDGSNALAVAGVVLRTAAEVWIAWRVLASGQPPTIARTSHRQHVATGGSAG